MDAEAGVDAGNTETEADAEVPKPLRMPERNKRVPDNHPNKIYPCYSNT